MNNLLNTIRLVTAYTEVSVGNPEANVDAMLVKVAANPDADIILFPELAVTGYTCGDLFNQTALLDAALTELERMSQKIGNQVVVVGLPFAKGHTLYNCAAVLSNRMVRGLVPKTYLPNYKEFYESRWFYPAPTTKGGSVELFSYNVPFGTDLLFKIGTKATVGVEICEDLWAPIPPSSYQAIAGANILLNLSASNETVAKSEYRRSLVENQSGRLVAAYAYCSSGPTESTTDLLFGGHGIVAENGSILGETERFKSHDLLVVDIDVEKLTNERRRTPTFQDVQSRQSDNTFRRIDLPERETSGVGLRKENKFPFVPGNPATLNRRCEEIFNIQVNALVKRMSRVKGNRFSIGISGGLDSTLALLVAVKACKQLGKDPNCIDAVTMPGFGTSSRTLENANKLMDLLGVSKTTIPIAKLCFDTFRQIGHDPFGIEVTKWSVGHPGIPGYTQSAVFQKKLEELPDGAEDVVFENVQARIRTMLLMSRGFVLGTGDMSELALGWATYNGDHMSMYNVNCSIPKTLVKFLVDWVAENEYKQTPSMMGDPDDTGELYKTLKSIVATEISPELLPLKDGQIVHSTEAIVGPYAVLDFFLFHLVRNNFAPKKIAQLAINAFEEYSADQIYIWLHNFLKRFFANQFKRSCVPDGPKVGSVSLSPRGDWRMPSDADPTVWLKN